MRSMPLLLRGSMLRLEVCANLLVICLCMFPGSSCPSLSLLLFHLLPQLLRFLPSFSPSSCPPPSPPPSPPPTPPICLACCSTSDNSWTESLGNLAACTVHILLQLLLLYFDMLFPQLTEKFRGSFWNFWTRWTASIKVLMWRCVNPAESQCK